MGAAIARALLASGRRVVVWNRTAERARPLVDEGAELQIRADEAAREAPLAIFCLSTTDDVQGVLHSIEPDALAGRTLLNVTTGTPDDAQRLSDWARDHQVHYLDGAIAAYPEQIGTQTARILVAGDEEMWLAYQAAVLDLAGASMHVGTDPGAANVIDAAMTGAFYMSSLVSFIEATRFMSAFGVSYEVLSDLVGYSVAVLEAEMQQILRRIADGAFATDEASLNVYADASEAFATGMGTVGDASIIHATARVLRQAVEAGLGDEDIAAVFTLASARAS